MFEANNFSYFYNLETYYLVKVAFFGTLFDFQRQSYKLTLEND